jgi:secreted protein with Ig-like and vWFA domain
MQKALVPLKSQAINDASTSSDYTENKFVTDDGFQVGYYVSKEKVNWYITLEKYGNGNTIFVKDAETIEEAFNLAKQRIDELKLK